jgi:hypothetical protein
MKSPRQSHLRALLLTRFEEEAADLPTASRLRWLGEHLTEYVDRWAGSLDLGLAPEDPCTGDLFGMVEVGAEVIAGELDADSPLPAAVEWKSFSDALARARGSSDERCREDLRKSAQRLLATLTPVV